MSYRVRSDLEIFRLEGESAPAWVVRDPLSGACYRFGAEEHYLLELLRNETTFAELIDQFRNKFSGRVLSREELLEILGNWVRQNLVLTDRPTPQSAKGHVLGLLARSNPLVIRFRGWNPQKFLQATEYWIRPFYSWPFLLASSLMICWALLIAVQSFDKIGLELNELALLFEPRHWILAIGILGLTKVFHELGHAYSCQRFGGACTEMGVMFLAFVPCLYCNVTDAWTFPRRSQRMAVSAAGILVDLWIASAAFLLWSISQPGLFHSLCLLLAVAGSVNSLLLNGNPLMRYDGYFILSDITGIANLRAEAMQQSRSVLWRFLFGSEKSLRPHRFSMALACYGYASSIYLWLVMGLILMGVYLALKPAGLQSLSLVLALLIIPASLISGVMTLRTQGHREMKLRRGTIGRRVLAGGLLASLFLILILYPFPRWISSVGCVRPVHSQIMIAPDAGTLVATTPEDQTTKSGEVVLEMSQSDLRQRISALETSYQKLITRELAIRRMQTQVTDASAALSLTRELLISTQEQINQARSRQAEFSMTSELEGICMRASVTPFSKPYRFEDPLDFRNLGQSISAGQPLAIIASPTDSEIVISIPEYWAREIQKGREVAVYIPELCGKSMTGQITQIATAAERSQESVSVFPEYVSLSQFQKSEPGNNSQSELFAVVTLDQSSPHALSFYQIAPVRIQVTAASFVSRFLDFINRTFTGNY